MRWKIWYGDGSVVASSQSSWEAAPAENVQIIAVYRDAETTPYALIKGRDYYDFDGEKVYKSDDTRTLPNRSLKYGKWVSKETIVRLIKEALTSGY